MFVYFKVDLRLALGSAWAATMPPKAQVSLGLLTRFGRLARNSSLLVSVLRPSPNGRQTRSRTRRRPRARALFRPRSIRLQRHCPALGRAEEINH